MHIPPELIIHQTRHWTLNQRIDSALPGYCMLGSRQPATAFHQLPEQALAEFGPLLARVEREMDALLRPRRIYVGRYGHMPGLPVHFHLIPLYDWVEELFWEDTRYRTLQQFGVPTAEPLTDGAELTLFVWREFCERADPPAVRGMDRQQAIAGLRRAFGYGVQPRTSPGVGGWFFWRGGAGGVGWLEARRGAGLGVFDRLAYTNRRMVWIARFQPDSEYLLALDRAGMRSQ